MAALLIAGPLLAFVGGASFSSRVALAPTATAALQLETLPSISVRPRPHPFAPPPPPPRAHGYERRSEIEWRSEICR